MTPVRIVKTARFKRIVISRSAAADEEKRVVRSGHVSPVESYRSKFFLAGDTAFSWSSNGQYVNANTITNSQGTHYYYFWGMPLRCLAIE